MWNQLIQSLHSPPYIQSLPIISAHHHPPSAPIPTPHLSRRHLALSSAALPLLLLATTPSSSPATVCSGEEPTRRAFLDVSIDGEPAGRITIGLYDSAAPAGSARLAALVSGPPGASFRRREFVKVTPGYVVHGGVRSYGADDELVAERAAAEERCGGGVRNVEGAVGIVVRDPARPPPATKLVARKGRIEVVEEAAEGPNGTELVIVARESPELDASTLVVGRVLDGMDVVRRMASVATVKDNTSSPYFRVAKLIGDKRAIVAERGFNRPYSKIIITNCGLLD